MTTTKESLKAAPTITETSPTEQLRLRYDTFRKAYRREAAPSYKQRLAHLDALLKAVRTRKDDIAAAISEDFGHRSRHETLGILMVISVSVAASITGPP